MHRDIFISYSRKDLELVKQIKEDFIFIMKKEEVYLMK
jgi:hypothetical protein